MDREHERDREPGGGRGLGVVTGAALCVGAVLGPGALTLASTAAATAGPASVLAWAVLVAVSLPVALVFAALGARRPDSGGVAAFVREAFGARAAAPVGWWFYWAVPLGVPAAALIGGEYVAAAAGWGRGPAAAVGLAVLAVAYAANLVGLRLSGRLQLVLVGLLAVLLAATVALSGSGVRAARFTPFAPHGWGAVGTAAGVLFFAFAGWEAVSHLSDGFRDPARDLPRATRWAWGVVAVLYLGLAVVTIGVLGGVAGRTSTPLTLLLERELGSAARPLAAVAALLLTFGAVNAYLAGAARLGARLAAEGALPRGLAGVRRSLSLVAGASGVGVVACAYGLIGLGTLLHATSACLVAVTLAGLAAAVVLLPRGAGLWWGAVLGCGVTGAVLVFCGVYVVLPVGLGVCCVVCGWVVAVRAVPRAPESRLRLR